MDTATALGQRNYTIILTLLDYRLRVSELLGLRLSDLQLNEGVLKVLGKGNKERLVPIGRQVQRLSGTISATAALFQPCPKGIFFPDGRRPTISQKTVGGDNENWRPESRTLGDKMLAAHAAPHGRRLLPQKRR